MRRTGILDSARTAAVVCLVACAFGCDGSRDQPFFVYTPPPSNTSGELTDMAAPVSEDMSTKPECRGVNTGGRCALPNATGVCVEGQCQRVACAQGWRDCNALADDGCERDITTTEDCGACGRVCPQGQTCQIGDSGRVCSSGVVCPLGTFDLDQRASCEWAFSEPMFADPQPFGRFEVDVARLLADGTMVLAGTGLNGRFVDGPRGDGEFLPLPVAQATVSERAKDLAILERASSDEGEELSAVWVAVVWGQDVSISTFVQGEEPVHRLVSRQTEGGAPLVPHGVGTYGASFALALEDRVVLERDVGGAVEFGSAQYRAAFFPEVDLGACGVMGTCAAFEPREVFEAQGMLVVMTRSGLVVLREEEGVGLRALGRLEDSEQTAGYVRGGVAAIEEGFRVAAWRRDGVVRTVDVVVKDGSVSFAPGAPDVGLRIAEGRQPFMRAAMVARDTLVLTDGGSLNVVRLQAASARIFTRREQVAQATVVDVAAAGEEGFDVATSRFGAVEVERVEQ